jgi:hypothetical protein
MPRFVAAWYPSLAVSFCSQALKQPQQKGYLPLPGLNTPPLGVWFVPKSLHFSYPKNTNQPKKQPISPKKPRATAKAAQTQNTKQKTALLTQNTYISLKYTPLWQ